MFNMKAVEPRQLDINTKFKFRCHKDISCFTHCCSNIDILLTPYDVLRMKRRLGLTSTEFVDRHVRFRVDEKSSLPYGYLKMNEDDEKRCPFVTVPEGCTIYTDRPASCRYYPVGQGTIKKKDEKGEILHEEFYFFVKEPHCKGYLEDTEWTMGTWKDDQEITLYDDMNREWKELLMKRNLPGKTLDQARQNQFLLASYDLDTFKKFVTESRFFQVFDLPAAEVEDVKQSEEALMKLAFRYLKFVLGLEKALNVKDEVLKEKAKKKD